MITYIYQKDSTLWAFEGPERPSASLEYRVKNNLPEYRDYSMAVDKWEEQMSTARESALPVVNANDVWKHIRLVEITSWWKIDDKGKISDELKPGETIALPGWALEKVYKHPYEDQWSSDRAIAASRIAYRLVRSEPEKNTTNIEENESKSLQNWT